ncbi:MAG: hypothetical protein ABH804_03070 [archaeon]
MKRGCKNKISNRLSYTLIAITIIILAGVGVYAWQTSSPSTFGHSAGEVDLSGGVSGNIKLSSASGSYGAGRVQALSGGDLIGYTLNSNTRIWDLISITSSTPRFAIRDSTAGVERLVITSIGNVGIGKIPSTNRDLKLDVGGGVKAEYYCAESAIGSEYCGLESGEVVKKATIYVGSCNLKVVGGLIVDTTCSYTTSY